MKSCKGRPSLGLGRVCAFCTQQGCSEQARTVHCCAGEYLEKCQRQDWEIQLLTRERLLRNSDVGLAVGDQYLLVVCSEPGSRPDVYSFTEQIFIEYLPGARLCLGSGELSVGKTAQSLSL